MDNLPKIYFRTIVKDIPDKIVCQAEFRTFAFDEHDNAYYYQPTVPLVVNLEVVSQAVYQDRIQELHAYLLNNKGGEKGLKKSSLEVANKNLTLKEANYQAVYQVLTDEINEVAVDKLWHALKHEPFMRIEVEDEVIGLKKRRFERVLEKISPRNRAIVVDKLAEIYCKQQKSKLWAQAKRTVSLNYVSFNDPRLFNAPLSCEQDEEGNILSVSNRHVFLVEDALPLLQPLLKQSQYKLDISTDEYASDYFAQSREHNRLSHCSKDNLSRDDRDWLLRLEWEMKHLLAKQQSFWRKNQWQAQDEEGRLLSADLFPTEWDYCQFVLAQSGRKRQALDLHGALALVEQYLNQSIPNSPFSVYADKCVGEPAQPLFELDKNGFKRFFNASKKAK